MTSYNGWTNYPTWNVKLWIDNDQGLADYANEIAADNRHSATATGEALRDALEEVFTSDIPTTGFVADIWQWAWGNVDWREIGEALIDDLPDEDGDDEEDDEYYE